ncbi:Peroxiredoxin [Halovenus aranensis]|uniref:Peroxiredoxin n=1 Tax=Halovenus aranensis TaxID=890420 RepID=A0A1G8TIX1_9EURY|nr:redoxin domain-containing protein [Halovenus aranensis]SDJ41556.1 Peroxiredoxin [Halovenus aranensis]
MDFDVVDLPATDHPTVGEEAPDFTRPLVNEEYWEDTSLSALLDSGPVLLVFHSMDGAFPATYLWNELRDRRFDDYELTVVGLSISSPYEHKSFIDEQGIEDTGFRLFSDPSNEVARSYDIEYSLDGMEGISEPRPAVFLIDAGGTIGYTWVAEEWPAFPDYDDLEDAVETELA